MKATECKRLGAWGGPLAGLVMLGVSGCLPQPTVIPAGVKSPFTGYSSALYQDDSMWVCRPDLPSNPCASADLSATEIAPDGSRVVAAFVPAKDPGVDCFYVYPTVDNDSRPGNHTDFVDTAAMRRVTLSQAARFQEVCRLYVPLYRQITVGTYAASPWNLDRRLEIAFSDVADAFAHYLGRYNDGRKVVVIGHSQGAYMTVELLRRFFDHDPVLQPRLLVGMPIGGRVEVPPGERVGGTFANLPLCASADETGCVVAFRSYREGANVAGDPHGPPAGLQTGCVNPGLGAFEREAGTAGMAVGTAGMAVGSQSTAGSPMAVGTAAGSAAVLSRTFFPTAALGQGALAGAGAVTGVTTPFLVFRGLYSARCVPGAGGYTHLAIAEKRAPKDARPVLFDPMDPRFESSTLGLHALEMGLAQGDLIDLVVHKARAVRLGDGTLAGPAASFNSGRPPGSSTEGP